MTSALLVLAGCTTTAGSPAPSPSLVAPPRAEEAIGGDALGIVGHHASVRLTDPRGDVWLVRRRDRAQQPIDLPTLDLTGTTVRHTPEAVRVRATLASSRRAVGVLDLGLGTSEGRWFTDVGLGGGAPTRFVSPDGDRVRCVQAGSVRRGVVLTVTVPRSCLNDPSWVTVRVLLSQQTGAGTAYENAHNARPFAEAGTDRLYPPG